MRLKHKSGRVGISEIIATVLTIAITIIAGAAVFGYVNGQAGVTERQYGTSVGVSVQYLEEQFSVVDMSFTSSTQVTLYLYNYGRISLSPVQVIIYDAPQATYLTYTATQVVSTKPTPCTIAASGTTESPLIWNSATNSGMSVSMGSISTLTLTLSSCSNASFTTGTTYYVKVTGLYGNTVVASQVKS